MNLAARAGRWSADHRKTAIWGWLAFVVIAIALGSVAGTKTISDSNNGNGESGRAEKAAARAFPENASETVIVQSRTLTATDPGFRAAVSDVKSRLARTGVAQPRELGRLADLARRPLRARPVRHPRQQRQAPSSRSRRRLPRSPLPRTRTRTSRSSEFGDASAGKALSKSFDDDFKKAETLSLPITLIILRARVRRARRRRHPAAARPDRRRRDDRHARPLSATSSRRRVDLRRSILLIGLAVGVDYSLFYLRREREERARGPLHARPRSRPPPPPPAARC